MSLTFNGGIPKTTKFYVPAKKGTLKCFVTGNIDKTTGIKYDWLEKGKVIESREFKNKKGFSDERIAVICEKIQTKVREGFDFMNELFNAQIKGGN